MAEIKINSDQWDQLSDEDKNQINAILRESNLLKDGDQIVGDPYTPLLISMGSSKVLCHAACETAAVVARFGCAQLPEPGNDVCLVAVEAVLKKCKEACDDMGG